MVKRILKWGLLGLAALAVLGVVLPDSEEATSGSGEAQQGSETVPPIETLDVALLGESFNGTGFVIGFPGNPVDGDTLYRLRVASGETTFPYSGCATTAVALAKFIKSGSAYAVVEGKVPVDLVGSEPTDFDTTFSGPAGIGEARSWLFDAFFDLAPEFQGKPLIIKIECE